MSPVRNVSAPLADVMRRSELRGARQERERLRRRAQAMHEAAHAGSARAAFPDCPEAGCRTLAELLADVPQVVRRATAARTTR